jgi:hypothetical protein
MTCATDAEDVDASIAPRDRDRSAYEPICYALPVADNPGASCLPVLSPRLVVWLVVETSAKNLKPAKTSGNGRGDLLELAAQWLPRSGSGLPAAITPVEALAVHLIVCADPDDIDAIWAPRFHGNPGAHSNGHVTHVGWVFKI